MGVVMPGQRFGRLVVIASAPQGHHPRWFCRCDCGAERAFDQCNLRQGNTNSCGCLRTEQLRDRVRKHGLTNSPEYESWLAAKTRCYNPNRADYPRYGGRGITMCDHWRESFEAFLADMGPRPNDTTLDRIDGNGPYAPGNCRWSTYSEQRRNQSREFLKASRRSIAAAKVQMFRERHEVMRETGMVIHPDGTIVLPEVHQ